MGHLSRLVEQRRVGPVRSRQLPAGMDRCGGGRAAR
jgi:hypothetical protein